MADYQQKNVNLRKDQIESIENYGRAMGVGSDFSTAMRIIVTEWQAMKDAGYGFLPHGEDARPVPVRYVTVNQ